MTDEQILEALEDCGAILKGHFKLTSGLHSDTYIQCARVLEYPQLTHQLAKEATSRLPEGLGIDLVAAPAVGGILFGYAVAYCLAQRLVFSERVEGRMEFRRSFEIPAHARVLVCEDVVTTGGSVKELIALIKAADAEVAAVVAMVDRGKAPDFGSPYYPLVTRTAASWPAEECLLCRSGEKINAPGSRDLAKSPVKP